MECKRCGDCCMRGGPALHAEDAILIEKGIIALTQLYTMRVGEFATDPVAGVPLPLEQEVVKIKGKGHTWDCVFHDRPKKRCNIYDDRPQECRAFSCWDTEPLQQMYNKDRLTRNDFLAPDSAMRQIIAEHEALVPMSIVPDYVDAYLNGEFSSGEVLIDMIRKDEAFREALAEKAGAKISDLDFFLGRPLAACLRPHGIRVDTQGDKRVLSIVKS